MSDDSNTGPLSRRLERESARRGLEPAHLTVLSHANDPYRQDTPERHEAGAWVRDQLERVLASRDRANIHTRGLHYALIGTAQKPDGTAYTASGDCWHWLKRAVKSARWLRYVPFDAIIDQRNDEPIIREHRSLSWPPYVSGGGVSTAALPHCVEPTVNWIGPQPRQPYRLAIFGEKSSLAEVVLPVAERYDADVYLMTGEISETHVYRMAANGAEDGRPLRVFTLADCDPAGWQMPVSIARKLQAHKDSEFAELDYEVRQVALTPDQVLELGLPSTPLKSTEPRAAKWLELMGVEQTEIDALLTLRPDALRQMLEDALAPFYDKTLEVRAYRVKRQWFEDAEAALAEQTQHTELRRLVDEANSRIEAFRTDITALNDALNAEVVHVELPPVPDAPEPVLVGTPPEPLVSSSWTWIDQTRALRAHKAYTEPTTGPTAIERARTLRAEGLTLPQIADKLNADGVLTRRGRPWTDRNLSEHLRRHS